MTNFQRRDLIQLLASGSLLVGDTASTASVTLYNISSKAIRVGSVVVPPFRTAGTNRAVDVITLTNETTNAGFKLTYNAIEGATVFVNGTNATAAAIQTALRTATSDAGLVVTGTTDTGPFTVTYSDGFAPLTPLSVTSASKVDAITLTGYSGTDTFKLTYNAIEGATVFTRGTNYTAAALQSALRTQTSDATLIVQTATIGDPGFVIVYTSGFAPLSDVTVTSGVGVTGSTASPDLSGSVAETGAASAALQFSDVAALTDEQRRDLQMRLAAGQAVPLG